MPRVSTGAAVAPVEKDEDDLNQLIAETGEDSIEKLRHLKGIVRGGGNGKYPNSRLAHQLADIAKERESAAQQALLLTKFALQRAKDAGALSLDEVPGRGILTIDYL